MAYLEDDLLAAVTRVVQSTRYIQGPEVEALETEIAQYCGAAYGVGVSSGTDALLISLMTVGIQPGDRILTSPYSFFATMGVILRLGAVPVFADIDPDSFNLSPEKVAEILENDSERTIKALIPVHLYGQCAEMAELIRVADKYNIPVIEDAAQAIGAQYPRLDGTTLTWNKAGAMGLAGCFSFFPSKNLGGIGDGGMVVTQDKEFAEQLVLMRNHGAYPKYYHKIVGGNFRLDPIQAAALRVKLPYLERWHRQRAENAHNYNELFGKSGLVSGQKIQLPQEVFQERAGNPSGTKTMHHIYNQYVLRVERRDELCDWLQKNDIGCEIYYPVPLNKQECLRQVGAAFSCPEAERAANETIALPIYPELSYEMQDYLVEMVKKFYS